MNGSDVMNWRTGAWVATDCGHDGAFHEPRHGADQASGTPVLRLTLPPAGARSLLLTNPSPGDRLAQRQLAL